MRKAYLSPELHTSQSTPLLQTFSVTPTESTAIENFIEVLTLAGLNEVL